MIAQNKGRHVESSSLGNGEQECGALGSVWIERGGYHQVGINEEAKRNHQRFFFCIRYALIC